MCASLVRAMFPLFAKATCVPTSTRYFTVNPQPEAEKPRISCLNAGIGPHSGKSLSALLVVDGFLG
jgi:hypothetical protein